MSLQSEPVPDNAGAKQSMMPDIKLELPSWLHFEPPDRERAKQYFRDNLPRRIRDPSQPSGFRLAKKGELVDGQTGRSAELYGVFSSSYKDMGDFGIGIGLYFSQLLGVGLMFALAGTISIPTITSYADFNPEDTPTTLKGSAVGASYGDLKRSQGVVDLIVICMLLAFCYMAGKAEDRMAEKIDLSQQTAQDYSVTIKNPPRDVRDPDEYQRFFSSKFGEVVYVTITLDNGPLLKKLAWRRVCEKKIAYFRFKAGETGETLVEENRANSWVRLLQMGGLNRTLGYWNEQMAKTMAAIQQLKQKEYSPKRVFVQFNTEQAQRNCLHQMSMGLLDIRANVANEYQFRHQTLRVSEPVEPSEVLWKNLHVPASYRLNMRVFTLGVSGLVLLMSYFVLQALYGKAGISAVFVSLLNFGLPFFMKKLSQTFEPHTDEGNLQASIMTKLVFARMINTAVLIFAVTPNDEMLSENTMDQVQAILIADCFTTPALRVLNFSKLLRQKVLANKAWTQETMNLYYEGIAWNLAERYTDMTKTLFVSLFYSTLLPTGLFVTAFSMVSTYWVDKYCLLRVWQRPPMLDAQLATQSRHYIVFAVFMHVIMSTYFIAGWPFATSTRPSCFITCSKEDWMSEDQRHLLSLYNPIAVIVTVLLAVVWFGSEAMDLFNKLVRGKTEVVGHATNITFRECHGFAYVPLIKHFMLPVPLLACDVAAVQPENLEFPAGVDPADYCLLSETDLPEMTDEGRRALFGIVKFYSPEVASGVYVPGGAQKGGLSSAPATGLISQPVGAAAPRAAGPQGVQMQLQSAPVGVGAGASPGGGLSSAPVGGGGLSSAPVGPPSGGGLSSAPVSGGLSSAPVGPPSGGGLSSAPVGPPSGGGLSSAPVGPPSSGGLSSAPLGPPGGMGGPPGGMGGPSGGMGGPPGGMGLGGFSQPAQAGGAPAGRQVRCPSCQAAMMAPAGMSQFRCPTCGAACAL